MLFTKGRSMLIDLNDKVLWIQDSGKYVFGIGDTLQALEAGVVDRLICWENLDITRYRLRNGATGAEKVWYTT